MKRERRERRERKRGREKEMDEDDTRHARKVKNASYQRMCIANG